MPIDGNMMALKYFRNSGSGQNYDVLFVAHGTLQRTPPPKRTS